MLKIISWNINGIRAIWKRGDLNWLIDHDIDVICFQETKAEEDQVPKELNEMFVDYYKVYTSSKLRKGYSGVAMYSKIIPDKVEGLGIKEFDDEGRTIIAHFGKTTIITSYFPNGGQGPHRLEYKLKFYDAFLKKIIALRKKGQRVFFCGDVNTAHTEIDLARPKANVMNTGFLPIERAWIDKVIKNDFIDVYRTIHPDARGEYTYWDQKTASRERNVGWRIDYFFMDKKYLKDVKSITHHTNTMGSDHCPVELVLKN